MFIFQLKLRFADGVAIMHPALSSISYIWAPAKFQVSEVHVYSIKSRPHLYYKSDLLGPNFYFLLLYTQRPIY